ncbi:MAG: family 78 glycoside hydrolase catalytic domain [Chloroflexi bacterium]|nr:family 78 glycoside hydrolase catalytic domain [Chloroflexota bacterium]
MEDLKQLFIAPEHDIDRDAFKPASYLRRVFQLDGAVRRAELQITACGLYNAFINGAPVTDEVFLPGYTLYSKRLQVQSFDVAKLLRPGANVFGVILGDGWWRGSLGAMSARNAYGDDLRLAARLQITCEDKSEHTIATDENWRATQDGPIRKSDWKDGELYDARLELDGWRQAEYDVASWHEARPAQYDGMLVPGEGEAIREMERIRPEILKTPDGSTVLDFQQNLFGYVEFQLNANAGHEVLLTHGEVLDENGNFTRKNFQFKILGRSIMAPLLQEICYIAKEGAQTYKPTFTAQGFRFVKLDNWPEPVLPENFIAIAVYSDMEDIGQFESSHAGINKLVENTKWSLKGNFLDIPTDCPTRERAGWTGDIASFCEAGSYLMNIDKFLTKWMKDVALQQHEDGRIANIVPGGGTPKILDGSAGWADAAIIVPYTLYRMYGNRQTLDDQYESMTRFISFMERRARQTHWSNRWRRNPHRDFVIDTGYHWGEWLEPGHHPMQDMIKNMLFPDAEVATAYFGYSAALMAEIALALNKTADAERFQALADNVKSAYRRAFTEDGLVKSQRQCRYVRPVALGLLPEVDSQRNVVRLNDMVISNDYRIGTGFLSTPFILNVLCDHGFVDTAYQMAENEKSPSWLYQVSKGATTIWEKWDGIDAEGVPSFSFNHYAFGAVAAWFFSYVAGIKPLELGFQRIRIKPYPGGSLTHADCAYRSAAGPIRSAWQRHGGGFHLTVDVPTATEVHLPDGSKHNLQSGKQTYTCRLP